MRIVFALSLLILVVRLCDAQWFYQRPFPTGSKFFGVSFTDANIVDDRCQSASYIVSGMIQRVLTSETA